MSTAAIIVIILVLAGGCAALAIVRNGKKSEVPFEDNHDDTDTEIDLVPVDEPVNCCTAKETVPPEPVATTRTIKNKADVITADEIRFHAYMLASADNFQKDPAVYWVEAEKQIKEEK